jgi:uncharacterized protein YneF (UPF0154 family)
LLDKDGVVKLTDFGVAQLFAAQRLTVTGGVIGTAEYMSPEQTEGKRATKTSDIYSLGAVLYVMLTGRPPFTGKSSLDILRKHQTAQFDRPSLYVPDMPRFLEEVVCQLLEKKPEDRFGDAHIVSLRLKEVVKRVELAHREESRELVGDELLAPTAVPTSSPEETAETRPAVQGGGGAGEPSPATIMRDMFKVEVDRDNRQSVLAQFFDQTWVLFVLFVLVILGGAYWFSQPQKKTDLKKDVSKNSEVLRLMNIADGYKDTGRAAQEERQLQALLVLINNDAKQFQVTVKRIEARLAALQEIADAQKKDGFSLAKTELARAKKLLSDGRSSETIKIAEAIIILYEDEPSAVELVEEARGLVTKASSDLKD